MSRTEVKDHFHFLKNAYFFQNLDDATIKIILAVCQEKTYGPGQIIFEEGDRAERFFIVLEGEVEVWKDYKDPEPDMLAVHGTGHLFGEMALIDDLPRSATVIARNSTRLLSMMREDFQRILAENSAVALSVLKSVSLMVRRSNQSFVDNLRNRNHALEKAYRELEEAQDELLKAERLSTLGKFSSLILHDIKNPLSILRGYAELILMNSEESAKVRKSAAKIIAESDRLNRLAGELLDYSRGDIRLNMQIVDLSDFVKTVVETIEERFRTREIAIHTDVSYRGPVLMDLERMLRVLLNLADNSRKAMPQGGEFQIHVSQEDSTYVLEVTDTGIGMSEEVKDKIFEPFFSFSDSGGTGLGMSIVKSIVEAHHGTLSVSSKRNGGTRFRIVMPQYS
jgi:signal transduction histidine kinase